MLMGDAYKSNTPLRHTVFTRRLLYGLTRNLDVTTAWPHALYVVTYYFIYTGNREPENMFCSPHSLSFISPHRTHPTSPRLYPL